MYKIKEDIDLNNLRKYGFKKGNEYPILDLEICIPNEEDREDFWLIPFKPNEENQIHYVKEDANCPIWTIHILKNRNIDISCVQSTTYQINNSDMENMFVVLKKLIKEKIVEIIGI